MDIKTQDCWLAVDVNERLPEPCGQYTYSIDVVGITELGSEITGHFELESLQFYIDDVDGNVLIKTKVTHWLEKRTNMIVLTEAAYLADKKKTAELALKHFRRMQNHLPNTL